MDHQLLESIIAYCVFPMEPFEKDVEEDVVFDLPDSKSKNVSDELAELVQRLFEPKEEEAVGKIEQTFVIDYKPAIYVPDKNEEEKSHSATLKFVDPDERPKLFVLPWDGAFRDLLDPTREILVKSPMKRAEDAVWYGCDMLGQIWRFADMRRSPYGKVKR